MRAVLIKLALRFFAALPWRVVYTLGGMGGATALLFGSPRRIAWINITRCFPQLSELEKKRLRNRCLRENARSLTELGPLWYWPREKVLRLVKQVSGREVLRHALRQERGLILLTPHFGAWELTSLCFQAHCALPFTCLYRPPRLAALEALVRGARERTGVKLVPTDKYGIRALYQALKNKQVIGILPDQSPAQGGGVFAPFFGVSAYTLTLVSRLARKSGAPVVFICAQRLPRGAGFHIHYTAAPPEIADPDPVTAARALNQGVEACIQNAPEQYLWTYKRFKKRPLEEVSFYDGAI